MRKRGAQFRRNTCLINPLFSLDAQASNRLAITERIAMDALLDHKATADHVGQLETLIETSIRATNIAKADALPHLDQSALDEALEAFFVKQPEPSAAQRSGTRRPASTASMRQTAPQ